MHCLGYLSQNFSSNKTNNKYKPYFLWEHFHLPAQYLACTLTLKLPMSCSFRITLVGQKAGEAIFSSRIWTANSNDLDSNIPRSRQCTKSLRRSGLLAMRFLRRLKQSRFVQRGKSRTLIFLWGDVSLFIGNPFFLSLPCMSRKFGCSKANIFIIYHIWKACILVAFIIIEMIF